MNSLTLFYDDQCALCRRAKAWLDSLPKYIHVQFVAYTSEEAHRIFPAIDDYRPEREILALADDGGLYQGGDAWIISLWATRPYREWAQRLAGPALRPLAGKLALAVASNRYRLSRVAFRLPDAALVREIEQVSQVSQAPRAIQRSLAGEVAPPPPQPPHYVGAGPVPVVENGVACACELDPEELTEADLAALGQDLQQQKRDLFDPL